MKTKILLLLIAAVLAVSAAAFAQDKRFRVSGSMGPAGIGSWEDASDTAKLEEYRDFVDGPFGVFAVKGRSNRFFLDGYGENLGRSDMYLNLQGGIYGQYKFRAYGNWLTHNFGFGPNGARTPYVNPGSHDLRLFSTDPSQLSNAGTPPWTSFKFATDRRDFGGTIEYSGRSAWYLLVDANAVHLQGVEKVDAAALGTSPGNGFIDLPYALHYSTKNVMVEGGYQVPRGHLSINVMRSSFGNDVEIQKFQNPFFGFGSDAATFAPDNDYTRISTSGMLRQLPLNSTLSGRITYDRGTNRVDMIDEVLNTSGSDVFTPTNPSAETFEGKVENTTLQVSFASEPLHHLDTRVYYRYLSRSNSSNEIEFRVPLDTAGLVCTEPGTTSPDNISVACVSNRYSYTKENPGLEAGYRLTHGNRLSAGFDFLDIKRVRFDSNQTQEKKVFVQIANTAFASWTARLKYQYMQRRSRFLIDNVGFNANSPFFLERFNRSFDVANLNQHLIKAYIDWTPIKFLDFGFEAYYKKNNYKDFTLGRTADNRSEFYGSISYGNPEKFRATLFGDIEFIHYNSYHRTVNASTCPDSSPNCFDPNSPPTTTAFNWFGKLKDKNWTIEFAADWPLREQLTFKGSAMIQETAGNVDFQSQTLDDGSPATLLFPIRAYDNTKHRSVNPRVVYLLTRQVEITIGYAFEKYQYKDDQFAGYQYTIGSGTTTSYLSGIYAFPDYRAHILYGTMRYLF